MKEIESPFDEALLHKLPLAYRYLVKRETNSIGELYRKVKFSQSNRHRSIMVNNYNDFKPLSTIGLKLRTISEEEDINE